MRPQPRRPLQAEIVERVEEARDIFTLKLRIDDPAGPDRFDFLPGQFNMLYLYGVGEVPISIVSDPEGEPLLWHTIRAIGRVTRAMARLRPGERIGLRGPFGRGWPLADAEGQDIVLVTGGLGCAPLVSVINYIVRRRARFRRLVIMQGVKHSNDLIWRSHYEHWATLPDTQVLLAADVADAGWPGLVGRITVLLEHARYDTSRHMAMLCGPEIMMAKAAEWLVEHGSQPEALWLSMERNMQCAVGLCGHCQFGARFVCRDGPIFNYPAVAPLLRTRGF